MSACHLCSRPLISTGSTVEDGKVIRWSQCEQGHRHRQNTQKPPVDPAQPSLFEQGPSA